MIEFEKRFLYTFADVEEAWKLIGKKGLFTNTYVDENDLQHRDLEELTNILSVNVNRFRGEREDVYWQFFYYDPNLQAKRGYYLENKQIQWRRIGNLKWYDCTSEPYWSEGFEYRIKPEIETKLTNREVAEWIARGEGQVLHSGNVMTDFYYGDTRDDEPCGYKIRKWSDYEWHLPTKEYIEGWVE